ncbi:glycosyltransferase family 39 protein [Maricaulis sp.]|uniref:ArnT family glycosyltransferase n=1 Tax=Maricaulis sp. TaxID=1486257 RepID=UPI001AFF4AA9|nr:glycosyltransferase family 39 protein [Maricaulis sp.]MBO6796142.1 glycosyltransferase family 39 protein [Maricaulis sp.]
MSPIESPTEESRWTQFTLILILVSAALRILALAFNPLELYADETQYWVWSREFDWGYFSKPPMIAWLIAVSTSLFGDTDFAVRLPAPLLNIATLSFLFLAARRLWNARTGFWVALTFTTIPAVWMSNAVMSTDTPMMAAWAAAFYCLVALRTKASWGHAVGLGVAIGLGMLAKYAMIYFVVGTGLSLVLDAPARRALLSLKGVVAAVLGTLILLPNLLWNAAHDFATVSHTAANANWGGNLFHPAELFDFLSGQLGVFGPALFVILIGVLYRTLRQRKSVHPDALLLSLFILPPLLTVSVQAFISRAHANWAVSAYLAGSLLVVFFLLQGPRWRRSVLWGSIAAHSVSMIALMVIASVPSWTVAAGLSNSTKGVRAWQETADRISQAAQADDYTYIVFDNRNVFHQVQRYGNQPEDTVKMWLRFPGATNHAEQGWPLPEQFTGDILIVSQRSWQEPMFQGDFARIEQIGDISIALDGNKTRDFTLWQASGHQRVERTSELLELWASYDVAYMNRPR